MTGEIIETQTFKVDLEWLTIHVAQHGIPDDYCRLWVCEDQLRGVATAEVTVVQE